MNATKIIDKLRASFYIKKKEKQKIERLLLTCNDPKAIVDQLDEATLSEMDKRVYLRAVDGFYNLYDYILKTKGKSIYPKAEDQMEIDLAIVWMINNNSFFNNDYTNELLLAHLPNGTRVIEFAVENDLFNSNRPRIDNVEVAKMFIEKGRYDFLENCTIDIYDDPINENETVFEFMLRNGIVPNIKFIMKKEYINYYVDGDENDYYLFKQLKNGKTVLETLLESQLPFSFDFCEFSFENEADLWRKIIETCYQMQTMDKLAELPESALDMDINIGDNKTAKTIDLLRWDNVEPKITFFPITKGSVAEYLALKKDFERLCQLATPEVLGDYYLYKDINIIEFMIRTLILENRVTIGQLDLLEFLETSPRATLADLTSSLMRQGKITPNISLTYAKYGIYLPTNKPSLELGIASGDQMDKYLYSNVEFNIDKGEIPLIDQFREAYNDEKSDPNIIKLIIYSFLDFHIKDEESAERDLQALIDIKKRYPAFILQYDLDNGAAFLPPNSTFFTSEGYIKLNNRYDHCTLNHEWGHAIHFIYDDSKLPSEIEELLPYDHFYFYESPIQKIIEICDELEQEAATLNNEEDAKQDFLRFIETCKENIEKYKEEIREEFRELFGSSKILLEAINSGKYSREVLSVLGDAYFRNEISNKEEVLENYVSARLKSEYEIFREKKYEKNNKEFLCYENFIDAYLGGALGSNGIGKNSIAPTSTHNCDYFQDKKLQFKELFANYVELRKIPSPNREQYITKLKEKTSPELLEALENYYLSLNITKSKNL